MNKTQIKQINKKLDKLINLKKLPTPEEINIPIELIEKYGISYTRTLRGLTDEDLDRMIGGESTT
jgi:hypothetical protein